MYAENGRFGIVFSAEHFLKFKILQAVFQLPAGFTDFLKGCRVIFLLCHLLEKHGVFNISTEAGEIRHPAL
jgi:hypothetical protein